MLPPPASITSPSLETACDIVLPPPEESLYTLPRRKIPNVEFDNQGNGASNQTVLNSAIGKSAGKGDKQAGSLSSSVGDPNNKSVRFESMSSPSNTSLLPQTTVVKTTVSPQNSNTNKVTNGTHSESSVW